MRDATLICFQRGCIILSRLSMLYPDRFHAFGWVGLSFMEPITFSFDLDAIMVAMKELLGYEGYSYWKFFEREDAPAIIEKNVSMQ
jgi:soluble epoxide hydrolase / lipid-phosphate phosphatase